LHNFQHKKLIEAIGKLDEAPSDSNDFSEWIKAEAHLKFLSESALADELVIYGSGEYAFVHSIVVPNDRLSPVDKDDIMGWNSSPYVPIASYVARGGRDDVWIERGLSGTGTKTLEGALQLVFGRTLDGWTGPGGRYYEIHQEYLHLTGIHWRPEKRAYCRFNAQGDLEPLVSVSSRDDSGRNTALVSFTRKLLEEYLVACNASLVRLFDFTLFRRSGFSGWSDEPPIRFYDSDELFYRQQVMPAHAAYTRGVQIIRPRRPEEAASTGVTHGGIRKNRRAYAEFISYDWRNNRIARISTAPNATVNYFNAVGNSLPFELSPAFFRPEVLLKYKADRDKYTVGERDVSCRATWHLEGIDVNEAGQVHAYICDLRRLPHTEQLHWLSFNEQPKTGISERAVTHDFKGEWVDFAGPLQKTLSIIRRWHENKVAWWTLRDEKLLNRVNTPLTESRDEWAEAFMDLAKVVVEGFETKPLRAKLDAAHVPFENDDKTIALLEKLLNKAGTAGDVRKLVGLRTVQNLRSKLKGHVGGSDAEQLAQDALTEHETFGNHFNHLCALVADELGSIERSIT
jgi:hypothetical protein